MAKKILIVEDEMIIAEDISLTLQKLGYEVLDVVPTGEKACNRIAENLPDLVLMDIKLRGKIDGIETARRIIKQYDIPIVYLTANADIATYEEAKLTAPYGYLIKPFKERELHAAIEMAFYKSEAERKIKASRERIILLHAIAHKLSASISISNILSVTFDAMQELSQAQYCAIVLYSEGGIKSISEKTFNSDIKLPKEFISHYSNSVFETGKSLVIEKNDLVTEDEKFENLQDHLMFLPIDKLGVFAFSSDKADLDLKEKIKLVELLLGHAEEAIKRVNLENKLKKMAIYDNLTGTFNRHYLDQLIEREIKQSKRYKSELAVVMADLNNLKTINDTYGHNVGDFVIKKIAEIIMMVIRESDIVIRYGGDEFLIILPHTGSEVEILKHRLIDGINDWNLNSSELPFNISIALGYAYWEPYSGTPIEDIISKADKEMYKNKKIMKEEDKNT